ncbi:D-alanine--D-alanine ligase family protein, partial [Streptosporangium minutum]
MSDLGYVLVLAGGLSYEREVSLRSGRRVSEVLRGAGIVVETRDTDASLVPSILADPPDAVFVTLHGGAGEDGAIRSVLELLSVPYVGAGPDACRVAFDKPTAKTVVRSVGLRTPDSVTLPKETFHDLGASTVLSRIVERLGLPLFVKPSRGGSALGASMVRAAEDLPAAMVGCFAYGDTALIERCVEGVEVAVSVVDLGGGPTALPAVEIVPDKGVYDYAARYTAGHTEFFAPARLSP